ncbi:MAG TPA: (2Fe-2S)-binding protein [Thermoanaerobaculia bacterium]|jgi:aerobic-type carbon monoxide dehydrogenase small subunit (CoxS/CutS family)
MKARLTVNGRNVGVDADDDTPLLWVLRDELRLTGTKYGCGAGICGACTVLQGNAAVRSCQIPLSDAAGKRFTTIEGLKNDRCQRAWLEEDVAQCGYCQSGMIMEACALLAKTAEPTDADIDAALRDHVCRCGTYARIRSAIHAAGRSAK